MISLIFVLLLSSTFRSVLVFELAKNSEEKIEKGGLHQTNFIDYFKKVCEKGAHIFIKNDVCARQMAYVCNRTEILVQSK